MSEHLCGCVDFDPMKGDTCPACSEPAGDAAQGADEVPPALEGELRRWYDEPSWHAVTDKGEAHWWDGRKWRLDNHDATEARVRLAVALKETQPLADELRAISVELYGHDMAATADCHHVLLGVVRTMVAFQQTLADELGIAKKGAARAAQLSEALVRVKSRQAKDGPCWCRPGYGPPRIGLLYSVNHDAACQAARAALAGRDAAEKGAK